MNSLQGIDARAERHDDRQRLAKHLSQPQVLSGEQFRRRLCWGKDRFYAAVKSGRFVSLMSVNASSRSRIVYVTAKVDAWIAETPSLGAALRPVTHKGRR